MGLELWLASQLGPLSHSFLSRVAKGKKGTSVWNSLLRVARGPGTVSTRGSDA